MAQGTSWLASFYTTPLGFEYELSSGKLAERGLGFFASPNMFVASDYAFVGPKAHRESRVTFAAGFSGKGRVRAVEDVGSRVRIIKTDERSSSALHLGSKINFEAIRKMLASGAYPVFVASELGQKPYGGNIVDENKFFEPGFKIETDHALKQGAPVLSPKQGLIGFIQYAANQKNSKGKYVSIMTRYLDREKLQKTVNILQKHVR